MIFDCFGYSLSKYNNNEINLANYIKQMYVKQHKKVSMISYNNNNIRYWVIPANNLEFYLFFDKDLNNVGWDFVSNTGITNKFKLKKIFQEFNEENQPKEQGFGLVQVESSICPMNICVVNIDSLNNSDINNDIELETTIFTEDIEVFKNEKEFYKKPHEIENVAAESIFPFGMFPGQPPSAVFVNGKVIDIQKNKNDLPYFSLIVESCGIKFNVFTTEKIGKKIKIGNVLSVKGNLFAKTLRKPIKVYEA